MQTVRLKLNSVVYLLSLLLLAIACSAGAFFVLFYIPAAAGTLPPEYDIKEVYAFEPWTLELDDQLIAYPRGGIAFPAYDQGELHAVIFKGPARYPTEPGAPAVANSRYEGVFVALDAQYFEALKGDTLFLPLADYRRERELRFLEGKPMLPVISGLGLSLAFPPPPGEYYMHLLEAGGSMEEVEPITGEQHNRWQYSLLFYLLVVMILILVLQILTLDLQSYRQRYLFTRPLSLRELLIALGLLAAVAAVELAAGTAAAHPQAPEVIWAAALLLLAWLGRRRVIPGPHFGLTLENLPRAVLVAVLLSVALICLTALRVPRGLAAGGYPPADLLLYAFLPAFLRELFWRGYLQTSLERAAGRVAGLLITVLLAAALHMAVVQLTTPLLLSYPFKMLEVLLFIPANALILGFFYQRTGNIAGGTVLQVLLLYLPRVLIF